VDIDAYHFINKFYPWGRLIMNRSIFSSLAGATFIVGLILAFTTGHFLPMLFTGLAFSSLFGSMASGKLRASYGGLYPFFMFIILAIAFYTGNWTWALGIPLAMIILGSFQPRQWSRRTKTIPVYTPPPAQVERRPEVPYYQPSTQSERAETPAHQSYDQGYQPAKSPERKPIYSEQREEYEQPQALYPQQPLPPQQ
jgi:hypothetical protein